MNKETKKKLSSLKKALNSLKKAVIEEAEKYEEFVQTIDNILKAGDTETKDKLNRLNAAVIEEAEKNEEFEQTIDNILNADDTPTNETQKPSSRQKRLNDPTPTRPSNRRDPAVLDPVDVLSNGGEDVLRKQLEALDEKQLKDIIADYGMDRSKISLKWKDKEKLINHLIDHIIDTAKRRSSKGDAFRDTGGHSH